MTAHHQLINQDSGNVEYYTPAPIVNAARAVMGGIDLDPASCAKANKVVRATAFFSSTDDGYCWSWHGRIWMNHPFGREEHPCEPGCKRKTCAKRGHHCTKYKPGNKQWVDKLVREFHASGHVTEACCICFAATSEDWFRPLLLRPQCFLSPRTNYYGPDGKIVKGVSKGSVVTYFGPKVARFVNEFSSFGVVKIPYRT